MKVRFWSGVARRTEKKQKCTAVQLPDVATAVDYVQFDVTTLSVNFPFLVYYRYGRL